MITFGEYLNEAYTNDMKIYLSKQQLSDIGNAFNKNFSISVQNVDFHDLGDKITLDKIKKYDYCIIIFNDGSAKIGSISLDSQPKVLTVWPDKSIIGVKERKDIKRVFGFDITEANKTNRLKRDRYKAKLDTGDDDPLIKQSNALKSKIEARNNKVLKELNALCSQYGAKVDSAFRMSGENNFYLKIEKELANLCTLTIRISNNYGNKIPEMEVSISGLLLTGKKTVSNFYDFVDQVKSVKDFVKKLEDMKSEFKELPFEEM